MSGALDGRIGLVTGGARGIGRGITDALLAAGAQVAVCGRSQPEALPAGARYFAADVREPEQVDALVDAVVAHYGRLDVAVNNAGGSPYTPAATASPRFTAAIVTLNLLAPMQVAQAANRVMQEQADGGAIVNITSVSAHRPSPGAAAYGAAKAGLVNATRTLAIEWAPKVRINCVSAGMIATERVEQDYGSADAVARVAATVPLGRMGTPADVAGAVVFLASPAAAYVSGADLRVDGGGESPPFLSALADE